MKLNKAKLKDILFYNKTTGEFIWVRPRGCNIRAGSVAGKTNSHGYRSIKIDGVDHLAHRLAWLYVHGEFPPDEIDHIDGDRSNNKLSNLRSVGREKNAKNLTRRDTNKSGCSGVCAIGKKWRAYITIKGEQVHLGNFDKWIDAIKARKDAEREHDFHENHDKQQ